MEEGAYDYNLNVEGVPPRTAVCFSRSTTWVLATMNPLP